MEAAGTLFDERGYDTATVREIGERAGLDAALIARYFGSKEGLYLAALQQGRGPVPTDPAQFVERMLSRSEERGSGPVPLAMVSPTLTDPMREQVREIMGRRAVQPLVEELAARGVPDPVLRTEILVAMAVGVSLTRASGTLPALAEAPLDEVVAVLEPMIVALQDAGAGSA